MILQNEASVEHPINLESGRNRRNKRKTRLHRRYEVSRGYIRVAYVDAVGKQKVTSTRVFNVSELGMAIETPEAVRIDAPVKVLSVKSGSAGSPSEIQERWLDAGLARSCRRENETFLVGVEFTDGVRWFAPEGCAGGAIPIEAVAESVVAGCPKDGR